MSRKRSIDMEDASPASPSQNANLNSSVNTRSVRKQWRGESQKPPTEATDAYAWMMLRAGQRRLSDQTLPPYHNQNTTVSSNGTIHTHAVCLHCPPAHSQSAHQQTNLLSSCHFCEKTFCTDHLHTCVQCQGIFCRGCSLINYDATWERVFCLSCTPR
jgi:hypothetical protein